jgi:branched-subunit amino acid aminotransferase/4-amino-4-deoxychorismate lyase
MSSTSNAVLTADQVWMDGKLVPWAEANVHVMTHALHYGLGVFEGIRAYPQPDGSLAIFRLREHIRRFLDSAHIIMMKLPYDEEQLMALPQRRLPSAHRLHGRRRDGPGRAEPDPRRHHRVGMGQLPRR